MLRRSASPRARARTEHLTLGTAPAAGRRRAASVAGHGPHRAHRHRRPIDGAAQDSSTTIAAVGGYAAFIASVLPRLGITLTLTSGYLAAMIGDIAASHLCSVPRGPPIIDQHVLPADQPGQTHAQACLLDHDAELRSPRRLQPVGRHGHAETLELADRTWRDQSQPPT